MDSQIQHIIPRPTHDPVARKRMEQEIEYRFISMDERRERVAAAMKLRGIDSMQELAIKMGFTKPWLHKILHAGRPTVQGVQRIAVALNVSVNYLLEKDFTNTAYHQEHGTRFLDGDDSADDE